MYREGIVKWVSGAVLGLLVGFPAAVPAQVSVLTIVDGETSVERSDKVTLTPLGAFEDEPLQSGLDLAFGDELSSTATGMAVVLMCAEVDGESEFTLPSPFRVVLIPTTSGQGCALSLQGGAADVVAGTDTEIRSGEVTLGSQRTQYGVVVSRRDDRMAREAYVFEGAVRISGGEQRPVSLKAGHRLVLSRAFAARPVALERKDIRRAAHLYAKVDASRTKLRGQAWQQSYRELMAIHAAVLSQPDEVEPRLNLAVARLNLNVKAPSTVQYLSQAQTMNTANTALLARTAMVKGMVYQELGKTDAAQLEFRAAASIDPQVSKENVGQAYKINPRLIQRIQVPAYEMRAPVRPQ